MLTTKTPTTNPLIVKHAVMDTIEALLKKYHTTKTPRNHKLKQKLKSNSTETNQETAIVTTKHAKISNNNKRTKITILRKK